MPLIVTADIHQTDLPKDEHRWGLFMWLIEQADKYKADIAILGDFTEAKDKHSARLTNDMALAFEAMAGNHKVWAIPGNHDGIDINEPFFGFLSMIEDVHLERIPMAYPLDIGQCLFLPHTKQPEKDWASLDFKSPDFIFCHQTFKGTKAENGFELDGIDPAIFGKTKAKVISGDIHSQQIVSRKPWVEYVGAPYRTRFGDRYEPRCLLIRDDGSMQDLHFPTKSKHVLEVDGLNMRATSTQDIHVGDQVKVRVRLPRSAYPDWPKIRKSILTMAENMQWELTGPELIAAQEKPAKGQPAPKSGSPNAFSPEQALAAYAERKRVSGPLLAAGEAWLKEARK